MQANGDDKCQMLRYPFFFSICVYKYVRIIAYRYAYILLERKVSTKCAFVSLVTHLLLVSIIMSSIQSSGVVVHNPISKRDHQSSLPVYVGCMYDYYYDVC